MYYNDNKNSQKLLTTTKCTFVTETPSKTGFVENRSVAETVHRYGTFQMWVKCVSILPGKHMTKKSSVQQTDVRTKTTCTTQFNALRRFGANGNADW